MKMPAKQVRNVEISFDDNGAGPPVLLVHGFPLDRTMWAAQAAALVDAGFRAIVPDLRGYGKSTQTAEDAATGVDMSMYADDLAALLDALSVAEPVVLAGFSMGGYIGWEFCKRHRAKLSALVLCDTKAAADNAEAAANRLAMAENVDTWGAAHVAELMIPKLFAPPTIDQNSPVVESVRRTIANTSTAAIAASQRGMARRADYSGRLAEFDLPVLAIGGEHDVISPPAEMQSIATGLADSRYVPIPDAGHMAPVENPAAVSAALVEFCQGLPH